MNLDMDEYDFSSKKSKYVLAIFIAVVVMFVIGILFVALCIAFTSMAR